MKEPEEWRSVVGYEGLYEVSDLGRIRRIAGGRGARAGLILRPRGGSCAYRLVGLYRDDERTEYLIHCLVAEAFLGPRPAGHEANHINGLKADNRARNLEWVTPSQNCHHAFATGLHPAHEGEANPRARLTVAEVKAIRRRRGIVTEECLAQQFGVGRSTVSDIQAGRTWKGVKV